MDFNTPVIDDALETVTQQFDHQSVIIGSYIRIHSEFAGTAVEDEAVTQGVLYINAPLKHIEECFAVAQQHLVKLARSAPSQH